MCNQELGLEMPFTVSHFHKYLPAYVEWKCRLFADDCLLHREIDLHVTRGDSRHFVKWFPNVYFVMVISLELASQLYAS